MRLLFVTGFPFMYVDHERPLSKPGRRDAMSVAHKLEQMGWIPEVILSRLGFASQFFHAHELYLLDFLQMLAVIYKRSC